MHEVKETASARDAAASLAGWLKKHMINRRSGRWIIIASGLTGLLVWVRDYDFFLNAGGPATPISNAILRILHLQSTAYPVPLIMPALVLMGMGLALGSLLARLLGRPRN